MITPFLLKILSWNRLHPFNNARTVPMLKNIGNVHKIATFTWRKNKPVQEWNRLMFHFRTVEQIWNNGDALQSHL